MRIVYALHGYKPAYRLGGPIFTASEIAERLVKRGCEVTVICSNSNLDSELDVPIATEVDVSGVKVHYFKAENIVKSCLPSLAYFSKSVGYLYSKKMGSFANQICKNADIAHLQMPFIYPNYALGTAAIKNNKPFVYQQHGVLDPYRLQFRSIKKNAYIRLVEKPLMQKATCLLALTDKEVSSYKALGVDTEIRIIPNGVNCDDFSTSHNSLAENEFQITKDNFVILFLGRLHPLKGIDKLLDAFSRIKDKYPNAILVIAGPNEHKVDFSAFSCKQIKFAGMVNGEIKKDLLARANLFCLPSLAEGFSYAVLEAMASATPVLLSTGCNFDQVQELQAGIIKEPSVQSLTDGLEFFLNNHKAAYDMGINARNLVQQHYSWDSIVDHIYDLYGSIIDKSRHSGHYLIKQPAIIRPKSTYFKKSKSLRFLFNVHGYIPAYDLGGPIYSVSSMARKLVEQGHHVTVITSNRGINRQIKIDTSKPHVIDGVEVRYFNSYPLLSYFGKYFSQSQYFRYDKSFYKWLDENVKNFDILHNQMSFIPGSNHFSRLANKYKKILLYSQRGNFDPIRLNFRRSKKLLYWKLVEQKIARRASCLIALNNFEIKSFRKLGLKNRIEIIPNCIEENYADEINNATIKNSEISDAISNLSNPIFLFTGRLHPLKGVDILIDSFIDYAGRHNKGSLIIAGPDEFNMAHNIKARVHDAGLDNRFIYIPFIQGNEKINLYRLSDIFVMPTRSEGLSISILEALSAGLPVITSAGAHFPEICEYTAGIVSNDQDISHNMELISSDQNLYNQMSRQAKLLIKERYSWDMTIDKYISLCFDLIDHANSKNAYSSYRQ